MHNLGVMTTRCSRNSAGQRYDFERMAVMSCCDVVLGSSGLLGNVTMSSSGDAPGRGTSPSGLQSENARAIRQTRVATMTCLTRH